MVCCCNKNALFSPFHIFSSFLRRYLRFHPQKRATAAAKKISYFPIIQDAVSLLPFFAPSIIICTVSGASLPFDAKKIKSILNFITLFLIRVFFSLFSAFSALLLFKRRCWVSRFICSITSRRNKRSSRIVPGFILNSDLNAHTRENTIWMSMIWRFFYMSSSSEKNAIDL